MEPTQNSGLSGIAAIYNYLYETSTVTSLDNHLPCLIIATMKIYLDVCCLSRPFDDLSQDRVRLESEAILTILERCQRGTWRLVGSEAVMFEIAQNPDAAKRNRVAALVVVAAVTVLIDPLVERRATELERQGLSPFDAVHLACAERGQADVFLTTDDELLRKARRKGVLVLPKVANPVQWLIEEVER